MQLSLPPVPSAPTSPAPAGSAGNNPNAAADSSAPAADSFDSYLSKPPADDKQPGDKDTPGSDAEKAAALLAALFWMPIAPVTNLPATTVPSLTGKSQVVDGGTDAAALTSCFGPTSSRSFGTAAPDVAGTAFQQIAKSSATDPTGAAEKSNLAEMAAGVVPANPQALPKSKGQFPVIPAGSADGQVTTGKSTDKPETAADANSAILDPSVTDMAGPSVGNPAQEKIAPPQPQFANENKTAGSSQEKYFLDPVQKAVTSVIASVGISVAKVNAIMSAGPTVRQKSASNSESATSFVFSGDNAPIATLTVDAPAPVATVRETMAAVISAVDALERRADIQHKSVDLQFQVGSEKLGLRVELRDGTVHTTFRTQSSEMTGALTREWHSVVQPALAREIKLADPVFSSSTTAAGESSTSLGQGSAHQREQQKAAPTFASALKREFYDSTASESAPVTSPATNSSQLLNVLA